MLYDKAISINPNYAEAYYSRGITKKQLGDYQGAIADYNKAISINPNYTDAYYNRGNTKLKLGNYQAAITDYDKTISINPNYRDAYSNRGNTKQQLGDFQGAITDYDKAISINPNYADAYNNRGNTKLKLGDFEGAITDYDKAISINPNYADAYYSRGLAKQQLGNHQGAKGDYDKAIRINPNDYEAYNNRGLAKFDLGDYLGAIQDKLMSLKLHQKQKNKDRENKALQEPNRYTAEQGENIEAERQAKTKLELEALRFKAEKREKLKQEKPTSEIERICEEYGIDTLIHFTKVQNLSSILQKGLLSRIRLENKRIEAQYNDQYRIDGCINAISVSISFPNYQMFYKYSINNRDEWVVLLLKPSLLWEVDCAFCQENAASNNVTSISLENRKQPSSLRKMFDDYGQISRENLRIQNNYPTNPQAEVLVINEIPPHFIKEVHFYNLSAYQQWIQNHSGIYNNFSLISSDKYFNPRADYQAWTRKEQSILNTAY